MTQTEALRLALEALIEVRDANIHGLTLTQDYHETIIAIKAALEAKDEPVQVSPLQFVEMVMEKEDCIGKPIIWAEWPNKEKNT
jgi:hypothetical protein